MLNTRHSFPFLLISGIVLAGVSIVSFLAGMGLDEHRIAHADRVSGSEVVGVDSIGSSPRVTPGSETELKPSGRLEERVYPATNANPEGRVPGEYEPKAAVLLGCNELVEYHPQTLVHILEAIGKELKIIGLVANEEQETKVAELLKANDLPPSAVDFFRWPAETMWVRDYGPIFLVDKDRSTLVDARYPEPNRDMEKVFNVAFATTFGFPFTHSHLTLEGGNLLSNGQGLCLTSTTIGDKNERRGYDAKQIGQMLHDHLHFDRWVHLKPLDGEPTGHVDMFATLPAVDTVVIGLYNSTDDQVNAEILDESAAVLQGESTAKGPMKVVRIPMPSHKDGQWRSYTNVLFANDTLLVPQYPTCDPQLDQVALDVYRHVLPNWKIVGIDCTTLIAKRGALHCISRGIPKLGSGR